MFIPQDPAILQNLLILPENLIDQDQSIHQSLKIINRLLAQRIKIKRPDPDHFSISSKINLQLKPQSQSFLPKNFLKKKWTSLCYKRNALNFKSNPLLKPITFPSPNNKIISQTKNPHILPKINNTQPTKNVKSSLPVDQVTI